MNYNEAMKYIQEVGNFGSNYGLERTFRMLEILGNPQDKLRLVHIAGTNGKGSTTAMITALLREKGFKVGMYTSPYLEEFEERIQINGENIERSRLGILMDKVKNAVDIVVLENLNHPTEFEIITCLMLVYFYEEKIDYGVIEVGLGGRLDSTNVINPLVSVITSISYDHTNLLGSTLAEIAREKAGIIKEGVPVVIYPQDSEALSEIKKKALEMNSEIYMINKDDGKFIKVINEDKISQIIEIRMEKRSLEINLPLLGEHQITNLILALKTYGVICKRENIELNQDEIKKAITKVKWIGRLEVMKREPLIVIDGAHNIQGIKALKENVQKYFKYKNMYLLLGILADKQVHEMVKEIVPLAKKVIALTPLSDRAELAEDLKKEVQRYNINCTSEESYGKALEVVLEEANKEDLILISGSLYMIGDMRKKIRNKFNIK